jgi:hypothetical protein
LIICLRKIIENRTLGDFNYYKSKFIGIDQFDFGEFKSSQYGRMGRALFEKYFK